MADTTTKQHASVLKRLRKMKTEGATANRGDGGRGFWPGDKPDMNIGEQIEYECVVAVKGFNFAEDMISFQEQTDPGCQFLYEIMEGEDEGKEVKGERFWIPENAGAPDNEKIERMRDREEGRFAAFLEDLCGVPFESWGQGVAEILELFGGRDDDDDPILLTVKFETYKYLKKKKSKSASGEGTKETEVETKNYREYSRGPVEAEEEGEDD